MSLTVIIACDVCDTTIERLGMPQPIYRPSLRRRARGLGWGTFESSIRKHPQDVCPKCMSTRREKGMLIIRGVVRWIRD